VAFGRLALREYYPHLTDKERDERETFTVVACYLMRDRFLAEEVWQNLDLGVDECVAYVRASPYMQEYQRRLFTRLVPTLRDIGLWGPRLQQAFAHMNVLQYAAVDLDEVAASDEAVAEEMERLRAARMADIERVVADGA
jgi:hypothetical protein